MPVEAAPQLLTSDDLLALPDNGMDQELIRGVLHEMPKPGGRHGKLANRMGYLLTAFADKHHVGEVVGEAGFVLERHPDTVRAPNVAFVCAEHADHTDNPKHITVPPDVAVEVTLPNDAASDVIDKARWWLSKGTRQVWVVDDPSRTVTVYFPDGEARVYGHDDTLVGGNVMPDFALPLTDLFR